MACCAPPLPVLLFQLLPVVQGECKAYGNIDLINAPASVNTNQSCFEYCVATPNCYSYRVVSGQCAVQAGTEVDPAVTEDAVVLCCPRPPRDGVFRVTDLLNSRSTFLFDEGKNLLPPQPQCPAPGPR
ncbi:uncharacterized protein LOC131937080 [Physella acuta]|uniref:uncharacterized protein LOC131937080 n=1 Tax=Physella acuta TaxID=109671 RepID=UPI0027DDA912|nr:uncharacterized protein LOC131937080 [Physella acuta]